MPLVAGSRLGPYEIGSAIGVGGMGQVYRARDTKLNRDVAIKILPSEVAVDPDRCARFTREAQVLASLNHPNIAAIHGFEESDGVHALILELVEGPTLAERIALGAIPLDDALPIARQIVDALDAAHEQGIVHRDLKPANVKLRPDGVVKLLDFGLAKIVGPIDGGQADFTRPGVTASPTVASPAMTMVGMILGTAAYMSPEQARGRPADKRSDIWAFVVCFTRCSLASVHSRATRCPTCWRRCSNRNRNGTLFLPHGRFLMNTVAERLRSHPRQSRSC